MNIQTPLLLVTAAFAVHAHNERQRLRRVAAAALESLLNAIDANDRDTGEHVRRVACISLVIARAAGLEGAALRRVERVALFHDIGKIHAALFDIVHDDDKLSEEERALIATHPQRGADVLEPLSHAYPDLSEGVLSHHERWDGSGYPRGLRGEMIPIEARIVAIADAFDAMTHQRRYRDGRSTPDAVAAVREGAGTQFDPALVEHFLDDGVQRSVKHAIAQRLPHGGGEASREKRRQRPPEGDFPDVKFRWRNEVLEPHSPDRRNPSPRG